MGLFEVPGWSVPSSGPVAEPSPGSTSKKRKRPSVDSSDSKLKNAEANIEKLVQKLRGGPVRPTPEEDSGPKPGNIFKTALSKHADRQRDKKVKALEDKKKLISRPMPLHSSSSAATKPRGKHQRNDSDGVSVSSIKSSPPKKKAKTTHEPSQKTVKFAPETPKSPPKSKFSDDEDDDEGLTDLQKSMKQNLSGARFRVINETLYKSDSKSSHQMMKNDSQMFKDYHAGFRHQVASWPTNPVETFIQEFSSLPSGTLIVDLGCGDAALAKALVPVGLNVLSYDLVSDGMYVVEADICDHIPLPGSEGPEGRESEGDGHVVDTVVCALSLMGTNWPRTIREAWRILKSDGELRIAEVASRFTDVDGFISLIESVGFELKSKDDSNSHFTMFEFNKIARKYKSDKEWVKLEARGRLLKPCEYKRR